MSTDINACETLQLKITDARTLILLLASPEASVSCAAADSLAKYADLALKNRISLLNQGIIKQLIDLCNSNDKKVRKSAVSCLSSTTEVAEVTTDMKQKELIEVLVKILSTEDQVDILDEAAYAVANISKDCNKVEIKKMGAVGALVKLLDLTDPDVKKNSAIALGSLMEDFSIRADIRYANGLRPILDLLNNEYPEVQENGLKCFIKASEDATNRAEFKKLNVIKRILDFLAVDSNKYLFSLALTGFAVYLDDAETSIAIANQNGIFVLASLLSNEDPQVKKQAAITFAKALKLERNQVMARDTGVLSTLATQISSNDSSVCSASAISLSALSRNEVNLLDLLKLGVIENLFRNIQNEEKESRRESLGALAGFCLNAKVRAKIRNLPENMLLIIKLLLVEDPMTVVYAADCLVALSEDPVNRAEIVKGGAVPLLAVALDSVESKVQNAACLGLSRLLAESEAQIILLKIPKSISLLVELTKSQDVSVCRNAAYAISIAAQNELNAVTACQVGAIDALIQLSKDNTRRSKKFAADALEKLLNYHLSAKYWLLNHLTHSNLITDGFYDIGYAGSNLEHVSTFPSITKLAVLPADKKREIILIDGAVDPVLTSLTNYLSELLPTLSPESQLKAIALAVAKLMGGAVDPEMLADYNYKFRVSELKLKLGSNLLPISQINLGTFYHRALLFKALCDKIGLKPCTLVRGDYNRAWNVVDVKNITLSPPPKIAITRRVQQAATRIKTDKTAVPPSTVLAPTAALSPSDQKVLHLGSTELESDPFINDDMAVIDLMFDPGRLIASESPESIKYQRQF